MRSVYLLLVFLVGTVATAQTLVPVESLGRRGVFAQGRFFLQSGGSVVIYDTVLRTAKRVSLPDKEIGGIEWTSATTPLIPGPIHRICVDRNDAIWMFGKTGEVSQFDGIEWKRGHVCPDHAKEHGICIADVYVGTQTIRVATCRRIIDIEVNTSKQRVITTLPVAIANIRFITDEKFVAYTDGLHSEIDLEASTIRHHYAGLDSSSAVEYERWLQQHSNWRIDTLQSCHLKEVDHWRYRYMCKAEATPHQLMTIAMLDVAAVRTREFRVACGGSGAQSMHIYDVATDKKEHVYLATERGVIVLPNPSPVKADETVSLTKLNVYPNPATSSLTVDLPSTLPPDATLLVLNATGSTMMQLPIHDSGSMQINVSGLATGSYLVQIRTMNEVRTAGFVVKR